MSQRKKKKKRKEGPNVRVLNYIRNILKIKTKMVNSFCD